MKMTIVIDSEDTEGIDAALKVVRLMHARYVSGTSGHKEAFGKIEYIKTLRKFVKESIEHLDDPDSDQVRDIVDIGSLRNTKRFADRMFRGER